MHIKYFIFFGGGLSVHFPVLNQFNKGLREEAEKDQICSVKNSTPSHLDTMPIKCDLDTIRESHLTFPQSLD